MNKKVIDFPTLQQQLRAAGFVESDIALDVIETVAQDPDFEMMLIERDAGDDRRLSHALEETSMGRASPS